MMRHRKLIVVLVVLCFAASGCIGSFGAFNKLLAWNRQATPNEWGNELIFLALNILPVYSLAMLGDMIIFNAIEFWGGDNPMRAQAVTDGDRKAVQLFSEDAAGKHMSVAYFEGEVLRHTLYLSQAAPDAPLVGRVEWADGRAEDFSVRAADQGAVVTRETTSRFYGTAELAGISLEVERIKGESRTALK